MNNRAGASELQLGSKTAWSSGLFGLGRRDRLRSPEGVVGDIQITDRRQQEGMMDADAVRQGADTARC